jgi:hypothetical protein
VCLCACVCVCVCVCVCGKLLMMLSSPDVDRERRDVQAAMKVSQEVTRRAVAAACGLDDPRLAPLLLAWLLREGGQGGGGCDGQVEGMVMKLSRDSREVVRDVRVRAAVEVSCCVRGRVLGRLLQMGSGEISWRGAVEGLGASDVMAMVRLHVRGLWSNKRRE